VYLKKRERQVLAPIFSIPDLAGTLGCGVYDVDGRIE
jgi:hypothetical protein